MTASDPKRTFNGYSQGVSKTGTILTLRYDFASMKQKSRSSLVLFIFLHLTSSTIADAPPEDELSEAMRLQPDLKRGEVIFNELCSQCHGEDAWGSYSGEFPQLAGQHSSVIIKQLADIRAGNRDNPTMYPIVEESIMGGTQEIADVAAYIATLPMDPDPDVGEGEELEKAGRLYMGLCSSCHGDNGEGDQEQFYPLIRGQHYEYLLRQLIGIREGKRRNAHPVMAKLVSQMSNRDFETIADYVSRLTPLESQTLSP